jgi:transcription antitermination protein NusB
MGARHSGREAALQILFQMEVSGASADEAILLFWRSFGTDADPDGRAYAEEAVRGVSAELPQLDEHIAGASTHWRVERMARVDRNVLRLGTWELAHRHDVPRAVALDEAVELAKAYGSDESSAFVNGVLNRIAETLGRQDDAAPADADRATQEETD